MNTQKLADNRQPRGIRRLWPFGLWLAAFFAVWLTIVAAGNHWQTIGKHWPIAVSMAFGSYIAGSTPMGGGTVGFPVLVLLFGMPGSLGRNFGLAIQSIGMVSASIYILSDRRPLEWKLLRGALVGSLLGTPFGAAFVAPLMPDLWVKLLFAIIWASFGVMHLVKLRELITFEGISESWQKYDRPIGLLIGVCGGVVASITGVGIDMMVYAVLVLLYRADLKIAIATSVLLMAFTSAIGIFSNMLLAQVFPFHYSIQPEVFANWLAAAPIVAIGAPFGALIVKLISRTPTLLLVSLLCIAQFAWTILHEHVGGFTLACSLVGVLAMNGIFHLLYVWGANKRSATGSDQLVARSTMEIAAEEETG